MGEAARLVGKLGFVDLGAQVMLVEDEANMSSR